MSNKNETYKKFSPLGELNNNYCYPTSLDEMSVVMNWGTLNAAFNMLQGKMLTIIDALGLKDQQAKALKDIIKNNIWASYRQIYACMIDDKDLEKIGFQISETPLKVEEE